MPFKGRIILLMCFLLPICGLAQTSKNAELEIVAEGNSAYQVQFVLGNYTLEESDGYGAVVAEGMVNMASHEGLPALPMLSRLLMLPKGSSLQVEKYETGEVEQIGLGMVLNRLRGKVLL